MATKGRIVKTPDVCGGDARMRDTRISVAGLVESRQLGSSDEHILSMYPHLTSEDLAAAWDYHRENSLEIDRAIWENEACMIPHHGHDIPSDLVLRGRELGFSEVEIQDAFDPLLPAEVVASILANSSKSAVIGA